MKEKEQAIPGIPPVAMEKPLLPHQRPKGFPMQPGQTFADLSPAERQAYFRKTESNLQGQTNARAVEGQNLKLSRG